MTGPEQGVWLARLESEHDNLRAALGTTVADAGETGLCLAAALWHFWNVRGHLSEGRDWLERTLAAHPDGVIAARADALNGAGSLAYAQGDFDSARTRFEEALAIRRALGDQTGIASSLNNLALIEDEQANYACAEALHAESLAIRRQLGDQYEIAMSLNNLGAVAYMQADYARAAALWDESLAIRRALGSKHGIATALHNLGSVAQELGQHARAEALHAESLQLHRELGDKRGVALSLNKLGEVASDQGEYSRAAECHEESLLIVRELGDKRSLIDCFESIADLAASSAHAERAICLLGAAAALRDALGVPATPVERERNERSLAAIRGRLGENAVAELLASGRTLSLEGAATEALTVLREIASIRRPG